VRRLRDNEPQPKSFLSSPNYLGPLDCFRHRSRARVGMGMEEGMARYARDLPLAARSDRALRTILRVISHLRLHYCCLVLMLLLRKAKALWGTSAWMRAAEMRPVSRPLDPSTPFDPSPYLAITTWKSLGCGPVGLLNVIWAYCALLLPGAPRTHPCSKAHNVRTRAGFWLSRSTTPRRVGWDRPRKPLRPTSPPRTRLVATVSSGLSGHYASAEEWMESARSALLSLLLSSAPFFRGVW